MVSSLKSNPRLSDTASDGGQPDLFGNDLFEKNHAGAVPIAMDDAEILYYPNWVTDDAAAWMAALKAELRWEQPEIIIAGKPRRIPRLQAWCGDDNAVMAYSGRRFYPQPWHPVLTCLRRRLGELLDRDFNSVLVNLYRDGNDSVGWHSDDEPELGPEPCIASISLGATRRFSLKKRLFPSTDAGADAGMVAKTRQKNIGLDLKNGDLLVMAGQTQRKWHHSLPKTKKCVGERVNLTFRTIINTA